MRNIILPQYNQYLEKVLTKIEGNLDDNLCIEKLAAISGYSIFHFQRIFKSYVGENIASYIKRLRIEKGAFMLKYQYNKISTVGMRIGFNSNTSFTRAFKSYYNISPLDFRNKYKNFEDNEETPDFSIITLDTFKVFFIRTFGNYEYSEPLAWKQLESTCKQELSLDTQYISICYDEPSIIKNIKQLRYEACVLYEEDKHKNIKNLTLKTIKKTSYAKFEFEGTLKDFDKFFYKVYKTFFHNIYYEISLSPAIQINHNNTSDIIQGNIKTDLLIPIN